MSAESDQSVASARLLSILKQVPQPKRVLEPGCGDCRGVPLAWMAGVLYIGVDLDLDALRRAVRTLQANPTFCPAPGKQKEAINKSPFHLIQADIIHFPLRAQFDLILVRHPDVDRHRYDWERIFAGIAHLLTRTGTLIVTAYSAPEVEMIDRWLTETRLIRFPLDMMRLAETDLVGRDRFVMVYQNVEIQ